MKNIYMERFVKRLTKGLLVGATFVLLVLISPLIMKENPFSALPWYLVPVVLIVTVLYGTGWYFGFALIKRFFRKALRINRNASIAQAIAGKGLILGIITGMFCFVIGCVISFVVGNYFMIADYLAAKKGKPAVSEKFKFDSDKDYDEWAEDFAALKRTVEFNEIKNKASAEVRAENAYNLDKIERGEIGKVTTLTEENGEKKVQETTVY